MRSSFFHNEPKDKINMVKLPIIMPSCLIGSMVNTDSQKKTLFNTPKNYKEDVLANLMKMVSEERLNVLNLDKLDKFKIIDVAKELGITTSKKSRTVLLEEIKAVTRIFLAGQGEQNLATSINHNPNPAHY